MIALAAVLCTAILCGSGLAALILWMRQLPSSQISREAITRAEWLATVEEIKRQKTLIETMRNALEIRKAFTPKVEKSSTLG